MIVLISGYILLEKEIIRKVNERERKIDDKYTY